MLDLFDGMILTLSKATKKETFKNVLWNSVLEKTDVWEGKSIVGPCCSSLVHRLASSASSGSRSETDLWALPQTHWSESAIQPETPRGSDRPRGVHMRPTDHSCQILAKVPSFLPRNQPMHADSKVFNTFH